MTHVFVIRISAIGDVLIAARTLVKLQAQNLTPVFVTHESFKIILDLIPGLSAAILLDQKMNLSFVLKKNEQFCEVSIQEFLKSLGELSHSYIVDLQKTKRSFKTLKILKENLPGLVKAKIISPEKRSLFRLWEIVKSYLYNSQNPKKHFSPVVSIESLQSAALEKIPGFKSSSSFSFFHTPQGMDLLHWNINKKFILLFPGASSFNKQWPKESWMQLIEKLMGNKDNTIVICGAKQDLNKAEFLSFQNNQVINLVGKTTLKETLFLVSQADLVLTGDSFPTHAADSYGVPAYVIFGPTSPSFGFIPRNSRSIVSYAQLACSPCSRHGQGLCRFENHLCMHAITPEHVYDELKSLKLIEC